MYNIVHRSQEAGCMYMHNCADNNYIQWGLDKKNHWDTHRGHVHLLQHINKITIVEGYCYQSESKLSYSSCSHVDGAAYSCCHDDWEDCSCCHVDGAVYSCCHVDWEASSCCLADWGESSCCHADRWDSCCRHADRVGAERWR